MTLQFKDLFIGQYFMADVGSYSHSVFCKVALTQAVIIYDLFGEFGKQTRFELNKEIRETFNITSPNGFPGYIFYSVKPGEKIEIKTSKAKKRFIESITLKYPIAKRAKSGWGK